MSLASPEMSCCCGFPTYFDTRNFNKLAGCAIQECYRPVDTFLEGHDLVLQAEEHNNEALINAVMASTPRHPLWLDVVDLMMQRAGSAHNVLYATGAHPLPHLMPMV